MPSPFPGMDPYLERYWDDVHTGLCVGIRAVLQPQLPKGLQALATRNVRLEEPAGPPSRGGRSEGDTVLVATGPAARGGPHGSSVATVDPVVIEDMPEVQVDRSVQVVDTAQGNRVVTAIEVLNPDNKDAGGLNRRYRAKLKQYARAGVNVVEVDLIRSPRTRLRIGQEQVPPDRRAAYYTCVQWATDAWHWNVYPMPLRDPLPTVPVPCRAGEPDVPLPLQPVLDRVYVEGGHAPIDYTAPLRPKLSPADAAWAAERIAGRRTA